MLGETLLVKLGSTMLSGVAAEPAVLPAGVLGDGIAPAEKPALLGVFGMLGVLAEKAMIGTLPEVNSGPPPDMEPLAD
jgi:hypothetical protein